MCAATSGGGGGTGTRGWIRLNADMLLLDAQMTLTDLIGVLVHEMVGSNSHFLSSFFLFNLFCFCGGVQCGFFITRYLTLPPSPPPTFFFFLIIPSHPFFPKTDPFPKHAYLILLTGTSPFAPPPAARAHAHYHQHHREHEREQLFARAIAAVNGALMRSTGFGMEVRG